MKLIIDIPKHIYDCVIGRTVLLSHMDGMCKAIEEGTPLPKGHGDLIDRSTLEPDTEWSDYYDDWVSYSYGQIADADVVIKADGGGEDEDSD